MQEAELNNILAQSGFSDSVESAQSLGGGMYNDSFVLDCQGGRYVLRLAPPDEEPKLFYEKKMMRSEPGIHRVVNEQTSVPAPSVVHYDFSREFIDRDFLIMEYLPGRSGPFDKSDLGDYVRQIHDIRGDCYGYPDREAPTGENWTDLFHRYVEMIFDDCLRAGAIDRDEHARFLSLYNERWDAMTDDVEPCLLHLDLWSANILTQDGRITGILDFDRGLYGDPELEFAVLDTYGNSTPQFFAGYGRERSDGRDAQVRRNLYVVYEIIKYAFIRLARGGRRSMARSFVERCFRILEET